MSLSKARLFERYARLLLARAFVRARPAEGAPRRILVLGYAGIGDLLFLLPFLRVVSEAYPKAHITFVSDPDIGGAELLPPLGLFTEYWTYGHDALNEGATQRAAARRVREGRFDLAIVCPATPLLPFAAALLSIPVRVGHCRPLAMPRAGWSWPHYLLQVARRAVVAGEFERRLVLNRKVWVDADGEHAVTRGLRLAAALGLATPALEATRPPLPDVARSRARAAELLPDAPGLVTVGLHIGSPLSQYHKIWAPALWGQACRLLAERYPLRVVLFGSRLETALAAEFAATFGGKFLDLTGQASLLDTLPLLGRCRLVLVNDTGIAKAAMAAGVPTATVWGPSAPSDCGSPWDRDQHLDIRIELPCSPCARLGMPQVGGGVLNYSNCGHHDCLGLMEPGFVAASIAGRFDALLSGR